MLEKDRERLEQGMSSMNYNKMAEYLTQCHTESPTGRDQKGNMLSSFRINEAEEEYDDMAYEAVQDLTPEVVPQCWKNSSSNIIEAKQNLKKY